MNAITDTVHSISGFLWDYVLLYLLSGAGIYFTIRLKGIQVRRFAKGWKMVFGGFSLRGGKKEGGLSSFQALTTAVAAQVGTGNIAGASTALVSGGAGAIFWMWLSAFFGMATIYAESVLAQKTRQIHNGLPIGGPAYYIKARFKGKFGTIMAGFFSVAIVLALGLIGNMVQSNSISASFDKAFHIPPIASGIVVGVVALVIFLGGIKRIASVTEKVVPIMALLYVVGSLIIIIMNGHNLGHAFKEIFVCAFDPKAMLGGALGITVQKAMHYGVARGLFSNEAGMGSTPHAHATADVKHPSHQGFISMVGVFVDTFIILTMTAMVILTTGALDQNFALPAGERLTGSALAQHAYSLAFGHAGIAFIAICMLFFAFTTIIGWYYFGEVNFRRLFGDRLIPVYAILVFGCIILGSTLKVDLVWNMSDLFNGLMVLPNLVALLASSKIILEVTREEQDGLLKKEALH